MDTLRSSDCYFDSFPCQDDPGAWQCFESLLKEALKIATLSDPDIFTEYIDFQILISEQHLDIAII